VNRPADQSEMEPVRKTWLWHIRITTMSTASLVLATCQQYLGLVAFSPACEMDWG
jgi:hypothetical protein